MTGVVKASFEEGDRKHRWTAEIRSTRKDAVDRKYKWTAEINGAKCGKLTPEIKGKHSDDIWTVEIKGPKSAAAVQGKVLRRVYVHLPGVRQRLNTRAIIVQLRLLDRLAILYYLV